MAGFMAALVAALWAYDGWNDLNMVSGEIRDPERTIPVALIAGVAIVAVLYIGVNAAVPYVMPASALAASPVPASAATQIAIGRWRAAGFRRHGALHVRDSEWNYHERRAHSLRRGPRRIFFQSPRRSPSPVSYAVAGDRGASCDGHCPFAG